MLYTRHAPCFNTVCSLKGDRLFGVYEIAYSKEVDAHNSRLNTEYGRPTISCRSVSPLRGFQCFADNFVSPLSSVVRGGTWRWISFITEAQ